MDPEVKKPFLIGKNALECSDLLSILKSAFAN